MIDLRRGDMLTVLPTMEADSIEACCTDPPYHLTALPKGTFGHRLNGDGSDRTHQRNYQERGFMNQAWDGGDVAFRPETWAAVMRVLKPGGYLLAFGGTRTYHRLACAIEDAGFEMRDTIAWLYGSGFPKSLDISKAIDRAAGAEREVVGKRTDRAATPKQDFRSGRLHAGGGDNGAFDGSDITAPATDAARQWSGWGTALKPAMELICVARKPLSERTVAANVLRHSTGGLNIDACRVACEPGANFTRPVNHTGLHEGWDRPWRHDPDALARERLKRDLMEAKAETLGRWPANVVHDGSADVLRGFPETGESVGGYRGAGERLSGYGMKADADKTPVGFGDSGSAARFFYTAKADKGDRADSRHPTVKPVDLMRWLVRLVCPPGGTVLDPFAGSGTTGEAAMLEGFDAILIEREAEHAADIAHRVKRWHGGDLPLFVEAAE